MDSAQQDSLQQGHRGCAGADMRRYEVMNRGSQLIEKVTWNTKRKKSNLHTPCLTGAQLRFGAELGVRTEHRALSCEPGALSI